MITYESKVLIFKLDENPLQCRISFLIFMESLKIIFSQYKETCEVLIDYATEGGEDIKNMLKRKSGIFHMKILMFVEEGYFLNYQ